MMIVKNGNMPAMPTQVNGGDLFGGLTKREQFAMAAMQGLCAHSGDYHTPQDLSSDAVMYADVLLVELEKDNA
jgi:hypothetical protein